MLRAGLLPLFGLDEITVLSGIAALWETDRVLAVIVGFFALVAPYAKTLALLLVQFRRPPQGWLAPLEWLGRLAMADIFLIALYIVLAKGTGVGRVETAWGLYLFTATILGSIALTAATRRIIARDTPKTLG